ncbi:MAG TPA: hypothetical protein VK661_10325 [Planctomycetota bacterium]|jgi:ATP synthase I subunit|nr:hypothetical protein [Planctomycetota bacterium]
MSDRHLLRNLSLAMLAVSIVAGGIAYLTSNSLRIALGIPAGAIIGLVTFMTWAWLLARLQDRHSLLLFGLVTLAKLAFYAGAFYLLIVQGRVHPMALAGGIALSVVGLALGVHLRDGARTGSRA